ncbi:MAG TPA: alpha-glucosidase/alpha-galactosidase [Candidatus Hydrogenedentes bacterium]|nr:alpha-glucosidase/alpha-galactosidase [Candidatus Hydrogenedentota bacterium]HOL75578.1 alpha-glucosidase/alpha-galactosidase [Candidatus Hydrogenedentota bacterium]HPO86998.1 alpha-glucosidase/alpha-galactosidase [Candidatus Hydrogenedentota bacterium]
MAIKVALIGAGSIGFTRKLIHDILSVPELQDTHFALTDIDKTGLSRMARLVKRDIEANKLPAKVTATTNRREALTNANYVFSVVRVGGLEAFRHDIEIPLKYGIDQCVGDTLCIGGIMYAQRGIPVLLDFCKDIREVSAPNCLFMNYSNPMAMLTWACNVYGGVRAVGLCHGVEGGWRQIAEVLGVKKEELDIICAGINHQTWYISVKYKGKEMADKLLEKFEKHPIYSKTEKVRIDMIRRFGYYTTESNGHVSEYVPWYRKRLEEIRDWVDLSSWINGETGGYLRHCTEERKRFETQYRQWLQEPPKRIAPENRSGEHGSYIIEALETGRVYRGHFNVVNRGCITNLPSDCIVEVRGYVDRNGISIPIIGDLPLACAATCNASIQVQRMAMEAAVHGDVTLLKQAALHDPLTAAVCNPPEIWQMVDEMLVAQAKWLPQYRKEIPKARKRLAQGKSLARFPNARGAARLEIRVRGDR